MTPLDFLLGALFVLLGYAFLGGAIKFADRLPLIAAIAFAMQRAGEDWKDVAQGIGLFLGLLAVFLILGMIGSTLLAKGVFLFLPL